MGWLFGVGGALLLGVATNVVYDVAKYGRTRVPLIRIRRSVLTAAAQEHDVASDGLIAMVTWSATRRLTPVSLVTGFDGRLERPHLFDTDEWTAEVARQRAAGRAGRTAYLSRIDVDHGEHDKARSLRVRIAESDYAECLATTAIARADGNAAGRLGAALDFGVEEFVAAVPPTMVSACVAVRDRAGKLLLLRRSLAVNTYPAQWTVGINETMKYRDEPGAEEDFFELVRRGLHEELGLAPDEAGTPLISWLGWSVPAACFNLVAIVRSPLTAMEIDLRRAACHSTFEHDRAAWVPFTRKQVSAIVDGEPTPDGSRRWSYLAPLVALEAWRLAETR